MPSARRAGRHHALLSNDGSVSGVPVIVYDAECDFCRRWAERLRRWSRNDIALLPLQEPASSELTGRPKNELLEAMHFVRGDGRVFAGASAVREALNHVSGGRLMRRLLRVPGAMTVADRAYAWIARRRRRRGCGGEHCS
jgi:predicted DCC family thiol-disulfide oxidoreductase YuxK